MPETSQHTTLDLLRHGQLAVPGIFCAPADAKVSETGMKNLFKTTTNGSWDIIVSSPQLRCLAFAEQLASQKQCELVINPQFKEMDFGDWVGIKSETLWQQHREQYQQLWETPDDFTAPNGESMQSFYARVQTGMENLLVEHQGKSILLITHGGVIRTILANALDITTLSVLKFNIAYAQMSRLHCYADGHFSLQFLGKES